MKIRFRRVKRQSNFPAQKIKTDQKASRLLRRLKFDGCKCGFITTITGILAWKQFNIIFIIIMIYYYYYEGFPVGPFFYVNCVL